MDPISMGKINKLAKKVDNIKPKDSSTKIVENACFYYGYPSGFSGDWINSNCAKQFAKFDIVIWGDRYEKVEHQDHANAVIIANLMLKYNPKIKFFGYIPIGMAGVAFPDSNLSIEEIKTRVQEWKAIGVTGIFLDEFGYDYKTSRVRQNEVVKYCHDNGLNVVANSWLISYAFSKDNIYCDWVDYYGNPNLLECELGENDYTLFEDMFYKVDGTQSGSFKDASQPQTRIYDAVRYYQDKENSYGMTFYEKFKTKTIALDGILIAHPDKEKLIATGMIASKLLNIDAYCAGCDNWGADGKSHHKLVQLPDFSQFKSDIKQNVICEDVGAKGYFNTFTAQIGNNTLVLTWTATTKSLTVGVRELLINGNPIDSLRSNLRKYKVLPTASVNYRGVICIIEGATLVADKVYVCLKTATDIYSWIQVSTG